MRKLKETATVSNTNGMGDVSLPSNGEVGSGDIPTSNKKKFKDVYKELEEAKKKMAVLVDSVSVLQEVWETLKSSYNLSGAKSTILLDELEDVRYDEETLDVDEKSLKVISKLVGTSTRDLATEIAEILSDNLVEAYEFTEEEINAIEELLFNGESNELNEGVLGSVLGGLGGLAFGKSIGKIIARVLGIKENSPLYNVLTSRLVGTAIGAAIGGGGKK